MNKRIGVGGAIGRLRTVGIILLFLVLFPGLAAGQVPSVDDIPVFPGAERDLEQEQSMYWSHSSREEERSYEVREYRVAAIFDEVIRFYLEELGATLGQPDSYLESGTPFYTVGFSYEMSDEDYARESSRYAQQIKDKGWVRQPSGQPGQGPSTASFKWQQLTENGDLATYSVFVQDSSRFAEVWWNTKIETEITVTRPDDSWDADWGRDQNGDDEEDDEWEADWDVGEWGFVSAQPTGDLLGIPFYPGWVFNPLLSAGMSSGEYHYYVFFSADSVDQVAAFYHQHLGTESSRYGWDHIFALKGKLPMPEEGLVIQQNPGFEGFPQTMITIQKCLSD